MGFLRLSRLPGSAFSGGRLQMQPQFMGAAGDYAYINYFKKAQRWDYTAHGGGTSPAEQDAFGYPTTLATSAWYTVLHKPTQASIGNPNWVLRWTGNATLFIQGSTGGSITTVSGSLTGSGGAGYYEFSTTEDTQFKVGVSDLNGSTVGNIELYRKDQETARNAGEKFNPDYIASWKAAKIGVIRMMDYQLSNTATITSFATRKPQGYYSYAATEYRSSLYLTGLTYAANNGIDYEATGNGDGIPSSGAPTHGMTIHVDMPIANTLQSGQVTFTDGASDLNWTAHPLVNGDPVQLSWGGYCGKFTDGNFFKPTETLYVVSATTNAFRLSRTVGGAALVFAAHPGGSLFVTRPSTLNLNGTGKVIIGGFAGNTLPANCIQPGNFITLIYDGFFKAWLAPSIGNGFVYPDGINNGVPIEDMLELAIKIGAHLYLNAPVMALYPGSDWCTGVATYIKNNAPSWMIPRFEGPNETFNTFSGFITGPYTINLSRVLWNLDINHAYVYGRLMRTIGEQVGAVYGTGNLGITYDILMGVQSVGAIGGNVFRSPGQAIASYLNRATGEWADGYRIVNINTTGANVTTFDGAAHGKSIGDPIFLNPTGNSMPSNLSNATKYYVANNANFSTTGFDITTVPGGGAFGQAGIAPGTGGDAPYSMYAGTKAMPCSLISAIVCTNYINPITQNKIAESIDAVNYYVNDNPTQKAARMANYVKNCSVSYALVTGWISGTTLHVTSVEQGDLTRMDSAIVGVGVTADTYLTAQLATAGGDVATFSVNNSQTVGSSGTPVSLRFSGLRNYFQATAYFGRNLPSPILKLYGYEGGWSPDYPAPGADSGNLKSIITAISKASAAVLTLSDTNAWRNIWSGENPAVVGGYIQLANLTGEYATYNGRIVQITGVSGSQVTVALDTTARTAAFSGGSAYAAYFMILAGTCNANVVGSTLTVNSGTKPRQFDYVGYGNNSAQVNFISGANTYRLYDSPAAASDQTMNVYTASINFMTDFRKASKDAPELKDITKTNFQDFYDVEGGAFPSIYFYAGASLWGVFDPSPYEAVGTPPQWQAALEF